VGLFDGDGLGLALGIEDGNTEGDADGASTQVFSKQFLLIQSLCSLHVLSFSQDLQSPPQSTSDSSPSILPFLQLNEVGPDEGT